MSWLFWLVVVALGALLVYLLLYGEDERMNIPSFVWVLLAVVLILVIFLLLGHQIVVQ